MNRFRLGLSFGHGGPKHEDGCSDGAQCDACGTKAGMGFGLVESAFTRELGEQLYERIPHDLCEVTRLNEPHETVSPTIRAQRARKACVHAVLSIHLNESASSSTHGAHMFFRRECRHSALMATEIARGWPLELRRDLMGTVRRGNYIAGMVEPVDPSLYPRATWLVNEYAPAPTVLVECGYASNPADCRSVLDPWVQTWMVSAMLRGIARMGHALAPTRGL